MLGLKTYDAAVRRHHSGNAEVGVTRLHCASTDGAHRNSSRQHDGAQAISSHPPNWRHNLRNYHLTSRYSQLEKPRPPLESSNGSRCLVILPTYNERANVARLFGKILSASDAIDILVVDDSSPDGTAAAVRELQRSTPRVRLIERARKMGLGSAYLLGFEMAVEESYGAACTMDADHSHDPVHLAEMLRLVAHYDLIIGSRYVAGGTTEGFNAFRKINSAVANILARRIVGKDIRDCTSGYRIYSTALLQQLELLALKAPGYSMLVELLYEARVCRARVAEYPINFKNRIAGKSKISYLEVLGSLRTLFRLKIRQLKARSALLRKVLREVSEIKLPLQ